MKLGVILPSTKLYGGVKRFLELGNIFVEKKHEFTVFTPTAEPPDWFYFKGKTDLIGNLNTTKLDALFLTEIGMVDKLYEANAKHKIFYHVREKDNLKKVLQFPDIEIFANSKGIYEYDKRKYKINAFLAQGGINTNLYKPKEITPTNEFTIMVYGRLCEKRKGTKIVVKACEKIYKQKKNIRLLLFDTPLHENAKKEIDRFTCKLPFDFILNHPVKQNNELFHKADIFVSAEKRAGWSNTTAEAMAAGIPVAATTSGTKDFLHHNQTGLIVRRNNKSIQKAIRQLMQSVELRKKLAMNARNEIDKYSWQSLADKIEQHFFEV